jgi:hypothetical protein
MMWGLNVFAGFCGETEEEHGATLDLLRSTCYDNAFVFSYSQRDKTHAARHLADDVPEVVKAQRLQEALQAYRQGQQVSMAGEAGSMHIVLVEGRPKRGEGLLQGRSCTMKRVIFPDGPLPCSLQAAAAGGSGVQAPAVSLQPGDYVAVYVDALSGNSTLVGRPLARTTTAEFVGVFGSTVPGAAAAAVLHMHQLPLVGQPWLPGSSCRASGEQGLEPTMAAVGLAAA